MVGGILLLLKDTRGLQKKLKFCYITYEFEYSGLKLDIKTVSYKKKDVMYDHNVKQEEKNTG